jgi:hypothetical protein
MNLSNKGEQPPAEREEERPQIKENTLQPSTHLTQGKERVSQGLERVRKAAREHKETKFTALLHHMTVDLLRESFYALKRKAAPGVDGVTWYEYETGLEDRLVDLHSRVHRGAYRAQPSRRKYIEKSDGRLRPLGIAALEDKIVQAATVTILNQIYEEDFLGFSYGFRPGRSQHDALDALAANPFDLWVNVWRQKWAQGEVIVVRYADDIVLGFQYQTDADHFRENLAERLKKFGLELHPDKTRRIEFGRFAESNRRKRGEGKPETFDFLGFTHISGKSRSGSFVLKRETIAKRMVAKLKETKQQLRQRMHDPVKQTGQWLRSVVQGYFNYHAVPGNVSRMSLFRYRVTRLWRWALRRRGQQHRPKWAQIGRLVDRWLPTPRVLHPYPSMRFAANHSR